METKKIMIILTAAVAMVSAAAIASSPSISADPITDAGTSGDVSWILVSSVLVFAMVPGIAFFYGGMLRKQSMSSMMTQTLIAIGVMTISWMAVGYSLAFSGDGALIGDLSKLFMSGVTDSAPSGISEMEFALFQGMFAMITAAIVLGACAERVRYTAMVWFLAAWSILVYAPMAHWVWGGGWFDQYLVVLDFAGGTVVHICAAITGIALVLFAGKRIDAVRNSTAHNLPLAFLGCAMLWIGWLGFNGGSSLAADGTAVRACVVSMMSAACGMMAWAAAQYMVMGRVGVLGMIAGSIAGLVGITPAAGYVGLPESMVIGAVAGVLCFYSVRYTKSRMMFDDALDVFAVHGVGGIWGAIATGIFAIPEYSGGVAGAIYGSADLLIGQFIAVIATLVYCFAMSYGIIWVLSKVMRICVTPEEEMVGQDLIEHGEHAYM
ncbi:ammonium transporter Amt [methanogenic archaeon mixed culture ISO4-G1]|nr:ammonium transporter Amt [methanogenic archaeon mixed culture ISO4-G1]